MGSIFKRKHKRPIPDNAEFVVKRGTTLAEWIAKDDRKHRAPVAKNKKQIQTQSLAYYIKYRDENDLWQIENTGAAEAATARQILHTREERVAKVRAGIINPAEEKLARAAKRHINEHVNDFEQYLKDKGCSSNHVAKSLMHIREAIRFLELDRFSELTQAQATRFIGHLRTTKTKCPQYGRKTRSPRTINSYIISLKSFANWMFDSRKCDANPLTRIKKLPEGSDSRHPRRAMTSDEFQKLLEAARNSTKKVEGVDGPTREIIYLTAALTGLRRKELASLTRADFRLDDPTPLVRIQGAYSKNKKTDEIPLHPKVVAQLQDYFERTQPENGQPVFPLRSPGGDLRATSRMMKADLDAARAAWLKEAKDNAEEFKQRQKSDFLKYSSSDGFVDFHANRVLFVTSLCRSNVGLVTAQKLAWHSDPKLTANIYSKITTDERAAAINGISLES